MFWRSSVLFSRRNSTLKIEFLNASYQQLIIAAAATKGNFWRLNSLYLQNDNFMLHTLPELFKNSDGIPKILKYWTKPSGTTIDTIEKKLSLNSDLIQVQVITNLLVIV